MIVSENVIEQCVSNLSQTLTHTVVISLLPRSSEEKTQVFAHASDLMPNWLVEYGARSRSGAREILGIFRVPVDLIGKTYGFW